MKKILEKINGITIIVALATFVLGWQLGHTDLRLQWENYTPSIKVKNEQPPKEAADIDFKLFWDTWNRVSTEYVDKKAIDPQKMYYGAIKGMVSAVGDPYTAFLPPEAQKSSQEELGGSFEGVGLQLGYDKEKRLVVIAPLQGTPAERAGMKAGDFIIKIDDKDTVNITLPEAVNLIRGPKGSKVNLEIFREGDREAKTVSLQRDVIVVKSVEYSAKTTPNNKKVSYIKLSRFGEKTEEEWNKAVSDTLASAPQGVILDLRNNPGGYLDGAVFIGSEFISSGDIVLQEDSKGRKEGYKVDRMGKLLKIPLVVLINKGSASASEIVAGAIQDFKRGKLVGETSFGKGTIQESQELSGGTGLHITKAKWLTPNGRWIHNTGLTPDVTIKEEVAPLENGIQTESAPQKDVQLDKALEVLDQSI